MKNGVLAVISGFSGAGKGTVVRELIKSGEYALSISATTRAPRDGEEDGREYFFITPAEFEKKIADGDLLEWARFSGNYYGTPKSFVLSQMEKGKNVILEIDVQGGAQIKKIFPEAVLIFLAAPSMEILKQRLEGRGTETAEQIQSRLAQTQREIGTLPSYDFLVVNDTVDSCVERIRNIIAAMQERPCMQKELIAEFAEDAARLGV